MVEFSCLSTGCSHCCVDTYMPLSLADITRLKELGFKVKDFVVKRGGMRRLRNRDGKCFFLEGGRCKVYEDRPTGCRFYPLIIDETGEVIVDPECSHSGMFEADPDEAERLLEFLKKLRRERKREMPK